MARTPAAAAAAGAALAPPPAKAAAAGGAAPAPAATMAAAAAAAAAAAPAQQQARGPIIDLTATSDSDDVDDSGPAVMQVFTDFAKLQCQVAAASKKHATAMAHRTRLEASKSASAGELADARLRVASTEREYKDLNSLFQRMKGNILHAKCAAVKVEEPDDTASDDGGQPSFPAPDETPVTAAAPGSGTAAAAVNRSGRGAATPVAAAAAGRSSSVQNQNRTHTPAGVGTGAAEEVDSMFGDPPTPFVASGSRGNRRWPQTGTGGFASRQHAVDQNAADTEYAQQCDQLRMGRGIKVLWKVWFSRKPQLSTDLTAYF